jgi:hypothetical protein
MILAAVVLFIVAAFLAAVEAATGTRILGPFTAHVSGFVGLALFAAGHTDRLIRRADRG